LRIAAIGTGGRAAANIAGVAHEHIAALCDVDQNLLGKASEKWPQAKRYTDFRVMLEEESEKIDAVLVGTPDHTHAPAAAMAMRLGKHVYCEKPLTHTVHEARVLSDLARQNQLVTQMGTQIHAGNNYRRVVERIQLEPLVRSIGSTCGSISAILIQTVSLPLKRPSQRIWIGTCGWAPPQNALTPKELILSTGDNSGTMATDAWVISAATTWIWCIGH
jgi:hypothetical protein